ncbi:MAG: DUF370 domain-containing protein [Selenomonadaceae bacterium]|nr:DUF370 domain-containing protein [Selenomonadaceae bacterium]
MFLHLGNDVSIKLKDIISIYDYDIFEIASNKKYLENNKECLIDMTGDGQKKKSLIVTRDVLYISAILPQTLKRRALLAIDNG